MRTSRAAVVSALLAVGGLNLLAACTPGDDNDIFDTTPTPTPGPTPSGVSCQVVWANTNAEDGTAYDVFVIDGDRTLWDGTGVKSFSAFMAWFQPAVHLVGNHAPMTLDETGAVVTTDGAFHLTLSPNGAQPGASVAVADSGAVMLLSAGDGGEVGAVDDFSFSGVFSAPDDLLTFGIGAAEVVLGQGTGGTAIQVDEYAFAVCYEP